MDKLEHDTNTPVLNKFVDFPPLGSYSSTDVASIRSANVSLQAGGACVIRRWGRRRDTIALCRDFVRKPGSDEVFVVVQLCKRVSPVEVNITDEWFVTPVSNIASSCLLLTASQWNVMYRRVQSVPVAHYFYSVFLGRDGTSFDYKRLRVPADKALFTPNVSDIVSSSDTDIEHSLMFHIARIGRAMLRDVPIRNISTYHTAGVLTYVKEALESEGIQPDRVTAGALVYEGFTHVDNGPDMPPTAGGTRSLSGLQGIFGPQFYYAMVEELPNGQLLAFINAPDMKVVLDYTRFTIRSRFTVGRFIVNARRPSNSPVSKRQQGGPSDPKKLSSSPTGRVIRAQSSPASPATRLRALAIEDGPGARAPNIRLMPDLEAVGGDGACPSTVRSPRRPVGGDGAGPSTVRSPRRPAMARAGSGDGWEEDAFQPRAEQRLAVETMVGCFAGNTADGIFQGRVNILLDGQLMGTCPSVFMGAETFADLRRWHVSAGVWTGQQLPPAFGFLDPDTNQFIPEEREDEFYMIEDGMNVSIVDL